MDAYLHVISVIKKLGYICDTSPYLIDYQYRLFSRRLNDTDRQRHNKTQQNSVWLWRVTRYLFFMPSCLLCLYYAIVYPIFATFM